MHDAENVICKSSHANLIFSLHSFRNVDFFYFELDYLNCVVISCSIFTIVSFSCISILFYFTKEKSSYIQPYICQQPVIKFLTVCGQSQ